MARLLPLVAVTVLLGGVGAEVVCYSDNISTPIVEKSGDYVIAGVFNLGSLEERLNPATNETELTCILQNMDTISRTHFSFTRAVGFAYVLDNLTLVDNYTLGYKMYTGCNSIVVNRLIAQAISLDESIVGAVLAGYKLHVPPLAGIITAYNIPAVAYIYSDEELMDQSDYPTLLSLLETEEEEAEGMIQYLREQDYGFIDIWYHDFSVDMAWYIYTQYVQLVGCGRINEYTSSDKDQNLTQIIDTTYNSSEVAPAKVQLMLFNNKNSGEDFLSYAIHTLGWTDTVFIFGYSNGRDRYISSYLDSAKGVSAATNTLVFFGSDFINVHMETFTESLSDLKQLNWMNSTLTSEFNTTAKNSERAGEYSSWIGYVMSGALVLAQSLNRTLQNATREDADCVADLRQAVFEDITANNHTIILENSNISLDFVDRAYSNGYTVTAYIVEGNVSNYTYLGRSSSRAIRLVNGTIPAYLESTPQQETCSTICQPGTNRKFYDVVNLPCCWSCEECQIDFYTEFQNVNSCSECEQNETNNEDHTGCTPTEYTYLTITSSAVLLGFTFSLINIVFIIFLIAYSIKMSSRPVIKAADPVFLVIFLFGLIFGNLGLVFTLMKPSDMVCKTELLLLSMFFTLVMSSLGLRALKIYCIFSAANNFKKPKFGVVCTQKGQLVMNTVILFVNTLLAIVVAFPLEGWHYVESQEETHGVTYLMCTTTTTYTMLPFLIPIVLFLATIYFAFIMRNFPHNFRETTSIFASTLIAVCSSAMFLTGYNLSPAAVKALLRAIMVYITIIAFLTSIFGPKLVIILRSKNELEEKNFITQGLRNYTVSNSMAMTDNVEGDGSVCSDTIRNGNSTRDKSTKNGSVKSNTNGDVSKAVESVAIHNPQSCSAEHLITQENVFEAADEEDIFEEVDEEEQKVVKISDAYKAVPNVKLEDTYQNNNGTDIAAVQQRL